MVRLGVKGKSNLTDAFGSDEERVGPTKREARVSRTGALTILLGGFVYSWRDGRGRQGDFAGSYYPEQREIESTSKEIPRDPRASRLHTFGDNYWREFDFYGRLAQLDYSFNRSSKTDSREANSFRIGRVPLFLLP